MNDRAEVADHIIRIVLTWAMAQPTIRAAALVGSHARGTAQRGSDIDLVILAIDPDRFRLDETWPVKIEWSAIGARVENWRDEDYGALWSRRLWLDDDRAEIEIGFAVPEWASVNPLDPGTRRVLAEGCRILYDFEGFLARALAVNERLGAW